MNDSFTTLLLQTMKLGPREVKWFFQKRTAVMGREQQVVDGKGSAGR